VNEESTLHIANSFWNLRKITEKKGKKMQNIALIAFVTQKEYDD
jgi:hypothetical protein